MASEVFTCEIDVILRTLVEEEEVWLLQFSFLFVLVLPLPDKKLACCTFLMF